MCPIGFDPIPGRDTECNQSPTTAPKSQYDGPEGNWQQCPESDPCQCIDFAALPPQTASDTSVPACEAHLAHESSSAVRVTGEKHRQYIQRIDNIDTYRGETRKIPKAILNNLTTSSHLLYTSIYNTSIYFKRTGTKSYKITGHHSNRSRSF